MNLREEDFFMYHRIKTTKPQQFIDITRKVIEEIKKAK